MIKLIWDFQNSNSNLIKHFIFKMIIASFFYLNRYQSTDEPENPKRTSYSRSITANKQELILDLTKINLTATSNSIKNEFNLSAAQNQ